MNNILKNVFELLEDASVAYCLIRDFDQLDRLSDHGEVDLLISPYHLEKAGRSLAELGFVRLPNRGYEPHHFFLAYDKASDAWLKLDFVTKIAYGKPIHSLNTDLAQNCLVRRQRSGSVFIPSPEDELVTLLLHCILDKEYFAKDRQRRIQALRDQVEDEAYISALLKLYWSPDMNWNRLRSLIHGDCWADILGQGDAISIFLEKRDRIGTTLRKARGRILRKLNRWTGLGSPYAPTVALLAPDGAGKSTLALGVRKSYYLPVHSVYMGLYQSNQQYSKGESIKGIGLALRIVRLWRGYLIGRIHQARGYLVIFDRYCYDALLPPSRAIGRLGKARRWLLGHACPAPDLVVMLDAPGETLFARIGEHSIHSLEEQRQGYLELRSRIPRLVVVDATRKPEVVRREVTGLIWQDSAMRTRLDKPR